MEYSLCQCVPGERVKRNRKRKIMQATEATEELGQKPGVTQGELKNDA